MVNTQEALKLIKKGWILKTHKNNRLGHTVWLKNPIYDGPGCAKYITHGVNRNLLKAGITPIIHKPKGKDNEPV